MNTFENNEQYFAYITKDAYDPNTKGYNMTIVASRIQCRKCFSGHDVEHAFGEWHYFCKKCNPTHIRDINQAGYLTVCCDCYAGTHVIDSIYCNKCKRPSCDACIDIHPFIDEFACKGCFEEIDEIMIEGLEINTVNENINGVTIA